MAAACFFYMAVVPARQSDALWASGEGISHRIRNNDQQPLDTMDIKLIMKTLIDIDRSFVKTFMGPFFYPTSNMGNPPPPHPWADRRTAG